MLMIGKQLTPQQRVMKGIADILGNKSYDGIGGVLMIGTHDVVVSGTKGVTTACTNGKNAWYADEFIDKLNDAELRFLILHEMFHVMDKHLTTYRELHDIDARRANRACDFGINLRLTDYDKLVGGNGWIKMPEGGCLDAKYRDMDTVQIFKLLASEPDDGQGGAGGESFDDHDWDGADEMSEAEKRELGQQIEQAIRQGAILSGKNGSGGDRLMGDLLKSTVDYKEAMREWVLDTCAGSDYATWKKPNRRYLQSGVFMPSGVSEVVGELVVACDMSGSIGSREIAQVLGELANIADSVNPEGLRLLYWDTEVCGDEYYERGAYQDMISSTKPKGGGGTDVACVSQYIKEKGINAQGIVIITDGYLGGDWGEWDKPVLWVMIDNPSTTAPIGHTVHVKIN